MSGFELEPDKGLVSSSELAVLVAREEARRAGKKPGEVTPPTDQTIRNYVKRGIIKPAEKHGLKMRFDRAAVAEILANRPERRHGGRRRGSGRKSQTPAPDPAFQRAADARKAIATVQQRAEDDKTPRGAVSIQDLLRFTPDELKAVLRHFGADEAGLTNAALDRLENLLKIQERERKIAVETGKLVVADEMLAAWNETLRAIVHAVEALPARLVDRVLPLAYPSREIADALISRLHEAEVEPELLDAVRDALSVPPGLGNLLRAAMADEVHDFRERIADQHGEKKSDGPG